MKASARAPIPAVVYLLGSPFHSTGHSMASSGTTVRPGRLFREQIFLSDVGTEKFRSQRPVAIIDGS